MTKNNTLQNDLKRSLSKKIKTIENGVLTLDLFVPAPNYKDSLPVLADSILKVTKELGIEDVDFFTNILLESLCNVGHKIAKNQFQEAYESDKIKKEINKFVALLMHSKIAEFKGEEFVMESVIIPKKKTFKENLKESFSKKVSSIKESFNNFSKQK